MKSEWKVTSQVLMDVRKYAVYRVRNVDEVEHSGNMEYATDYMEDRAEAERIAFGLNVQYGVNCDEDE